MTEFADVERFGRDHGSCDGIVPRAGAHPAGGFLLTLTCACGATLERRVSPEEAKIPLPLPRALARVPPPPPATPSRQALEAAVRAAVEAEETAATSMPPASPPAPAEGAPRRVPPEKLNLDSTIRSALEERSTGGREGALARRRRAARRRSSGIWLTLVALIALGALVAVRFTSTPDASAPSPSPVASTADGPLPAPRSPEAQPHAALSEVMRTLRQLQASSSLNTSLSSYASQVAFAKADVDRFLSSGAPERERALVREVLDIHVLAAAAWKARATDQKEAWEAVGQEPGIELCASVKRVVDFAAQPELTRAQARGAAVASAIPLLWECAAARIEAIDHGATAD